MEEKMHLTPVEEDILKEIGNMCAGNATTALAQIIGRRIELEMPEVSIIAVQELSEFNSGAVALAPWAPKSPSSASTCISGEGQKATPSWSCPAANRSGWLTS